MLDNLSFPRLVATPDGGSRFTEAAIPVALQKFAPPAPPFCVSHLAQATQCGFLHLPPGWYGELHPSPMRMWIFVLQGEMLFEATDGGTWRLSPGNALLLEDTVGRGHASRVLGTADVTLAVVGLAPALTDRRNIMTNAPDADKAFTGSIPQLYDTCLVPMIFAPYAADLARRLASMPLSDVLEVAAGTGAATRALAATLPDRVAIVATDLNQAMLDHAAAVGTKRPVVWRQADAMRLPFADETFDAVVCQFGAMFFPDKPVAFAEARRVLRPGGVFIFSVWDRITENEFADAVTTALETVFPQDPPRFLARTPHGYHEHRIIARDLADGGFESIPAIDTVAARSRAASPRIPALAYCQGTPLRIEIEARGPARLEEATGAAAQAIAGRFGPEAVDGKIQAHVVTVGR